MRIEDIQDDQRISLHLIAEGRQEALQAVAKAFVEADPSLDREAVFESLLARETVATTGIGDGVAVPHARLPGVRETQFIVATCPEGLDFESVDGRPVNILVGVLSPADRPRESIRALSEVARRLKDPAVRRDLVEADTPAAAVRALRRGKDQGAESRDLGTAMPAPDSAMPSA